MEITNGMKFEEYQKRSRKSAIYPRKGKNFIYPTLGLVGEAGEVADKVSKILRDDNEVLNGRHREELKKEIGDVLWYVSQLATELNLSLEDIALINIEKLESRKERGKISGSGDNR